MSLNNHSRAVAAALYCARASNMLVNSTLLPLFELSGFCGGDHARLIFVFGRTWNEEFSFRWRGIILGLMKANELAIVLRAA